jgi:hypothetical protein
VPMGAAEQLAANKPGRHANSHLQVEKRPTLAVLQPGTPRLKQAGQPTISCLTWAHRVACCARPAPAPPCACMLCRAATIAAAPSGKYPCSRCQGMDPGAYCSGRPTRTAMQSPQSGAPQTKAAFSSRKGHVLLSSHASRLGAACPPPITHLARILGRPGCRRLDHSLVTKAPAEQRFLQRI